MATAKKKPTITAQINVEAPEGDCCGAMDSCCKSGGKTKVVGGGNALYGLGVIGAAVYYIQLATGFWMGALGLLKAFFWPAFVVYKVFQLWAL